MAGDGLEVRDRWLSSGVFAFAVCLCRESGWVGVHAEDGHASEN